MAGRPHARTPASQWEGSMTVVPYPAVVFGDMLLAAADDVTIALTAADARRLAARIAELLELAGYELVHPEDR